MNLSNFNDNTVLLSNSLRSLVCTNDCFTAVNPVTLWELCVNFEQCEFYLDSCKVLCSFKLCKVTMHLPLSYGLHGVLSVTEI